MLHCALCIVAYQDRKATMDVTNFLNSVAGGLLWDNDIHVLAMEAMWTAMLCGPWHATMYKLVTFMVRCSLGMQQCEMHNAAIQKTNLFWIRCINIFVWGMNTPYTTYIISSIDGSSLVQFFLPTDQFRDGDSSPPIVRADFIIYYNKISPWGVEVRYHHHETDLSAKNWTRLDPSILLILKLQIYCRALYLTSWSTLNTYL